MGSASAVDTTRTIRAMAATVVVFLLGILMGRLVLDGSVGNRTAWAVFLLALPVVVLVLTALVGFVRALVLAAFFVLMALLVRTAALGSGLGWAVFPMAFACLFAAFILAKTLLALRQDRLAAGEGPGGDDEREAGPDGRDGARQG